MRCGDVFPFAEVPNSRSEVFTERGAPGNRFCWEQAEGGQNSSNVQTPSIVENSPLASYFSARFRQKTNLLNAKPGLDRRMRMWRRIETKAPLQ